MKYLIVLFSIFSIHTQAQMNCYYQQHASYAMDIDVDVKNFQYQGTQDLVYTNNSPDELDRVYFHLYWNAFQPGSMMDQRVQFMGNQADGRMVDEVKGKRVSRISQLAPKDQGYQKIKVITQNGEPLDFFIEGTLMTVQLIEPVAPNGGKANFHLVWEAQVPEQIRRSGKQNSEGIELSMTQWYPKIAEYDYEGWHTWEYVQREFQGVFADFEVNIHIDKEYVVAAGGVLQNPMEVKGYGTRKMLKNPKSTWKYTAENIHDFAWSADPDYVIETKNVPNGPKLYFARQNNEQTEFWKEAEDKTVEYFQIMNEKFGKYLYPTYTIAQGGDGGMEYGMITLVMGNGRGNTNADKVKGFCGLVFHEASHSWYQQMLGTNESMRAWMDEGFTSFAEAYCMAKVFPNPALPYYNAEAVVGLAAFQKTGREELASNLADQYETGAGYSYAAYVKGSVFLSTLSYIVGEEVFWEIMMEYYNTWKLKHPTDKDFLHIAQKVSGMDLKWYLNFFIYTKEKIDYSLEGVTFDNGKALVSLKNNGRYPMPIDLLVTLQNGEKITYNIPLRMMRDVKTKDFYTVKNLPSWQWTSKEYTAELPYKKSEIQSIEIDGTYRLPNVSDSIKKVF